MDLVNKMVLIAGYGVSGKSAGDLVRRNGGNVIYCKDFPFSDSEINSIMEKGDTYVEADMRNNMIKDRQVDLVVLSPSIPISAELVKLCKRYDIECISEIDLGSLFCKAIIVGVTGTNGKTTVTTLINEVLVEDKINSVAVGNIGVPFTSIAETMPADSVVVVEVSSYQLENSKYFSADVGVVLNISKDHLSRHKTMSKYVSAKSKLITNLKRGGVAVFNQDDKLVMTISRQCNAKKVYFSKTQQLGSAYATKTNVCYGDNEFIMSRDAIKIVGNHNLENILAVVSVVKVFRVDNVSIARVMQRFNGIKHRIQFVDKIDEVTYINDSKSTNVNSTVVATKAFNQDIALILGGLSVCDDYTDLFMSLPKNVKHIIVFGDNAKQLMTDGEGYGNYTMTRCLSLNECVLLGRYMLKDGGIVLFSPASKSFDMYDNYEDRGDHFISIVGSLHAEEIQ